MRSFLMTTALAITLAASANAAAIRAGFDGNTLPGNDDGSTGAVNLGFDVNFFGQTHGAAFVNNNGNITFGAPLGTYTPFDLTSTSTQIIAPFFADVDTRNSSPVTYGTGDVGGRAAFGVNWVDVGGYGLGSSLRNSFQLVLIERGDRGVGQFDIEFNYGDITWDRGTSSGVSARAGWSNGTGDAGTFYELPGSAQSGAFVDGGPFSLSALSGGRSSFTVDSTGTVAPAPVPLPATAPLMVAAVGAMAAMRRKRRAA